MRNLLVVLIGLFVFIGCSKDDKEEDPRIPLLMEMFNISPNDTSGLKIFGFAHVKKDRVYILDDTIAILGNKNGKLWIQLLSLGMGDDPYMDCKKINSFTIDDEFNDEFKIELGYGEEKVIKLDYIRWDGFAVDLNYIIVFHDQKNFAISTNRVGEIYPSWIIYNNTINNSKIRYYEVVANGYWGSDYERIYNGGFICNQKGEILYRYPYQEDWDDTIFINLYEYIKYSGYSIIRQNGETGKIIWETQFEKMGQVIDGHEPKIEHSMQLTGNSISCTFNITNYDSSKETKNFNVNIETGEVTKL